MTGIDTITARDNKHVITSKDGKAAVWAGGTNDDLWQLGKPVGEGGLWKNSKIKSR
jgi:hypothetical protein